MNSNERGYMIIGVMFLLVVGMFIAGGMLTLTATNTKTRALVKTQAQYYYDAEETVNKTVAWMQLNSKSLVTAFTAANFPSNFDFSTPSEGENEGQHFQVTTLVKMSGSNNAVMLSNNDFFGESAFPTTTHIDTGAPFDAAAEFQNADLGNANARIVLMWARETNGSYAPIFRVDAVTGNNPDRGVHSFTYVFSQLEADLSSTGGDGVGFYTEDGDIETKNKSNTCDSYLWTYNGSAWAKGAPRSNCRVMSKKNIKLESKISGDVMSSLAGGVQILPPKGEVSGDVCEGASCHSHSISPFPDWSATCSGSSQGNRVINGNVTLSSGPTLADQCWETIEVGTNATLTLDDTENPYHFKTLKFHNNSNSRLNIPTLAPDNKVTLYVDDFDGGRINGNQMYNTNNAPRCFEVNVTSGSSFKLNGNADMNAHFIAPLADIEHLGNFEFHGSIECSQFAVTGNGTFNFDEGIGGGGPPPISDLKFAIKKASQRYR